jgi:hypothetical protein
MLETVEVLNRRVLWWSLLSPEIRYYYWTTKCTEMKFNKGKLQYNVEFRDNATFMERKFISGHNWR